MPDLSRYRMNPLACRELVSQHGSQRAAARAIGVNESRIRYWLDPDKGREIRARCDQKRYDNMSWLERHRRQLEVRRFRALQRMARRAGRS